MLNPFLKTKSARLQTARLRCGYCRSCFDGFKYKAKTKKKNLVCLHTACSTVSVYIIHYFQSTPCITNIIWIGISELAVLRFHGKHNTVMEGYIVVYTSKALIPFFLVGEVLNHLSRLSVLVTMNINLTNVKVDGVVGFYQNLNIPYVLLGV